MTDRTPFAVLMDLWADGARQGIEQASAFWKAAGIDSATAQLDKMRTAAGLPAAGDQLSALWRSAVGEYEADLDGLPPSAFEVDLRPLAEAWGAVTAGTADERQQGMVQRFSRAMAVKAKLGAEYYADPDEVRVRPTPRELVSQEGTVELFRYEAGPDAAPRRADPVLIVYSVINRSYILDLQEGCSVVRHLLDRGLDVWMIEWSQPHEGAASATLADYLGAIGDCVDRIRERTDSSGVSLFGHCIGGTLAAMYAALRPAGVSRLLSLTAPFRSPEAGLVATIVDPAMFPVGAVTGAFGKMPAKLIRYTFVALKPYYELMKWKMFVGGLDQPDAMDRFAAIDKWANDNVDVPAEVFRVYIDEVFHSGRLARGETVIDGARVDLSAIACPVLNVAGGQDWIVPPDSARPLDEQAADARYEELPGSHLTLILDPRMHERWSLLSDFLLGEDAA